MAARVPFRSAGEELPVPGFVESVEAAIASGGIEAAGSARSWAWMILAPATRACRT